MKWQGAARVAVAAAGVGTAVAIVLLTRDRPVSSRPELSTSPDPETIMQAGRGTDSRFQGDRQVGRIGYEAVRQYADGRTGWEHAELELDDGTRLSADLIETRGRAVTGSGPGELVLTGSVRLLTAEGAHLQGESATYDDATGVATVPGEVSFARGRMSGTGTGGTYDRTTGTFRIAADPRITTAADEAGAGRAEATAQTMAFLRTGNAMLFEGDARITHGDAALSADRATLYLAEDQEQFRVIELRGQARVRPVAGGESALPEMEARDIDLAFAPGTQLFERALLVGGAVASFSTGGRRSIEADEVSFTCGADGRTVTRLEGTGRVVVRTPASAEARARTIRAATLVATGNDQQGLTAAVFGGSVTFSETLSVPEGRTPATRSATGQSLALSLRGDFDAIDEAQFQRDVTFSAGTVTGTADLGTYRARTGELELRPSQAGARRYPHVTDEGLAVDARDLIRIGLDSHDVYAAGDVKTISEGQDDSQARPDALFRRGGRVYGFGAEFRYEGSAKRATYTGAPARLQQEESFVSGQEIVVLDHGRELTARQDVTSAFQLNAEEGARDAAPGTYRIAAEQLDYADASRVATYTGDPAVLNGPDGEVSAGRIVLTLEQDERRLSRLEATVAVRADLAQDRQAVGDSLIYDAAAARYTLRGRPLLLRSRKADGQCQQSEGAVAHFDRTNEVPEWREAENPGGIKTGGDVPCRGLVSR